MSQKFILNAKDAGRDSVFANLTAFLAKLSPDRSWKVEIAQHRKDRTNDQNAALWGLAYPALQAATGQPVNDWHEYMLGEYFGWVEYELFGKRKLRPARTTTTGFRGEASKLSTAEFADFYSFIQQRAAENGVCIPDPDPMHNALMAAGE